MITGASRHPIVTWSIAWGLTGIGLQVADVFSEPRRGPLWVAIVAGLLAWAVAGAATFDRRHAQRGAIVWAGAYLLAFWSGAVWGHWFEHNQVGAVGSAGFVGALLGWSAGAAAGALVSACLETSPPRLIRPVILAVTWGLAFLVAGYVGLIAAMILAQAAKGMPAFLGSPRLALAVGWGLGCALGGLIAAAVGVAARRALMGRSPEAAV